MSTSPLLPCKDPPLLHRLTLRASSSQHNSMDDDPRPLVHHGGDRRLPVVPPRLVGTTMDGRMDGLPSVHSVTRTPPVPARRRSPSRPPPPPQQAPLEREVITLAGPHRGIRTQNEYVDNPATLIRGSNNNHPTNSHNSSREMIGLLNSERGLTPGGRTIRTQPKATGKPGREDHNKLGQTISPPILADSTAISSHLDDESHDSIICKKCGKCKCNDCTSPRELPSRWICEERFECSATQLVEYCSCVRCVKCVFYHCENSEDNMSTADVPCACCERPHCCKRWTCMGLMSLCVPCLCLYWPLRAVVGLTTACYNGCSRRGCQCHRDKSSGQALTKRPLIDSESSSA